MIDELEEGAKEIGKKFPKKYLVIGAVGVGLAALYFLRRSPNASESVAALPSMEAGGSVGGVDSAAVVDSIASVIGENNSGIIDAINTSNASLIDAIQTGYLETGAATNTPESNILYRDTTPTAPTVNKTTATLPSGEVVSVDIVNGKTQTTLPVGSVVDTAGGDFKITGGQAGNYTSVKVQNPVQGSTQKPKTTISAGTATDTKGTTKPVTIVGGKTQTPVSVGTVVHTKGGDFKVTGGTPGNYTSVKVS